MLEPTDGILLNQNLREISVELKLERAIVRRSFPLRLPHLDVRGTIPHVGGPGLSFSYPTFLFIFQSFIISKHSTTSTIDASVKHQLVQPTRQTSLRYCASLRVQAALGRCYEIKTSDQRPSVQPIPSKHNAAFSPHTYNSSRFTPPLL